MEAKVQHQAQTTFLERALLLVLLKLIGVLLLDKGVQGGREVTIHSKLSASALLRIRV